MLSNRRVARAQLGSAAARASRNPGDPEAAAAVDDRRREYREVALAEHIAATVAAAPPLSGEQLDRLVALLRPAS